METNREHMRLEMESLSRNEEFARVVTAVFMSRLDPTLEEVDDVKTAVSEAVTNAVIHGYRGDRGTIYLDLRYGGTDPDRGGEGLRCGYSGCETGYGAYVYHGSRG